MSTDANEPFDIELFRLPPDYVDPWQVTLARYERGELHTGEDPIDVAQRLRKLAMRSRRKAWLSAMDPEDASYYTANAERLEHIARILVEVALGGAT